MIKFKKYQCSLSKEGEFKLKIIELTRKYESIFLKIINNKKLSSDEELLFYKGIKEVKDYVFSSIFNYNIDFENKLIVKLKVLYNQNNSLSDDSIKDIIEDVIYEALGYNKENQKVKTFKKTSENSYFIKYVQIMSIYALLKKMENECEYYHYCTTHLNYFYEDNNDLCSKEQTINILFKKSKFDTALPERTLLKLKNILLGKEEATKDMIPYLEYLAQLKEKNEDIFD